MNPWLEFILRFFLFFISFWIFMEFVYVSRVPTWLGIVSIAVIITSVVLVYTLHKHKFMNYCDACSRNEFKYFI